MAERLPIDDYGEEIVSTVRDNQVTVIVAETGAGKSTKVPLMLLEAGFASSGMIGVTEPRRVAAMNVSEWVAHLHGSKLGGVIGYQIGGERKLDRKTQVAFMTEGIVLRQLHNDPYLRKYSVLIVDEVHERGVNQDLLIALLRQVIERRPDLKVVIMSATIDAGTFSEHFGNAPIITVPGRVFPVEVSYLDEMPFGKDGVIDAAVDEIVGYIRRGGKGDILCFMPDEKTIKKTCDKLEERRTLRGCRVLPLYGSQAPDEQREVFRRGGGRRIIVSTNIAETSLTIDGVEHVVDSGQIKAVVYVSASMSALEVTEHSQAGCNQRTGRAGRTKPGTCMRLYSLEDFEDRDDYTEPEIDRMALDQVLLHLRTLGYSTQNVIDLPWMDAPPKQRWLEAEARLRLLGALDAESNVTEDGKRMERFPLAPMLGRMIIDAEGFGCLDEIITVVAGFTSRQVFTYPRGKEEEAKAAQAGFKIPDSDALTMLGVWQAWDSAGGNGSRNKWARDNFLSSRALREIDRSRSQISLVLGREDVEISSNSDRELISKAVAAGLIVNLCVRARDMYGKLRPHEFKWQDRSDVYIHPGSALFRPGDKFGEETPEMMVCAEIIETSKCFARGCSAIDPAWLMELIPEHALDIAVKVEQDYSGVGFGDGIGHKFTAVLSWQGMEIRKVELKELNPTLISALVVTICEDMVDGYGFHPQVSELKAVYRAMCEMWGIDSYFGHKDERVIAFVGAVAQVIAPQFATCQTLEDVMAVDISLPLEEILTEDEVEAVKQKQEEAREARLRREAQTAERRERDAEASALREQEDAAAMERAQQELDALKERFTALGIDLGQCSGYGYGGGMPWKVREAWRGIEAATKDSWWSRFSRLDEHLMVVKRFLRERETEGRKAQERADAAREAVLEQFPACPLCSGEWEESAQAYVCGGEHNADRLIALDGSEHAHVIGAFNTFRGEGKEGDPVATLLLSGTTVQLRLSYLTEGGWQGRTFKRIVYEPSAAILPEELVSERDAIMELVNELRELREQAEAAVAQLRNLQAEAGVGQLKRLTFSHASGQAQAREQGVTYRADFSSDPYPGDGETWYCRVVQVTAGITTVFPVLQVSTFPEYADEHCATMRELFPDLPTVLLS